jgi:transcription termination factor Rho
MSVIDRAALEESPLADLHAIASELSIDGYRRLRKEQLIGAILERQEKREEESQTVAEAEEESEASRGRRRRGRRGGRGGSGGAAVDAEREAAPAPSESQGAAVSESQGAEEREEEEEEETAVEGQVELLPNGSGFLRVDPPEPSDDDIYISAAQVKRCELISGDRISGPRRPPRRSERFASLVRIDTINGQPATDIGDRARFDDLPAEFPHERLELESDDATVKAIESMAPIGKGSRVTVIGPARAGKTEALRRLAAGLAKREDVVVLLVLVGVRPEEIPEWRSGPVEPAQAASLAMSADAQDQAVGTAIDQARRLATRGADAVVLLDTLDGLHPHAARRTLAAARKIVNGGSVTVIATASEPHGGETTVIALDEALARTGQFPALDVLASGTIRAERLVGEEAAAEIVLARTGGGGAHGPTD